MREEEGASVQRDIDLVPNGRSRGESVQLQVRCVLLSVFLSLVFGVFVRGGCLCGRGGGGALAFCMRGWRAESMQGLDLVPGVVEEHVVVLAR